MNATRERYWHDARGLGYSAIESLRIAKIMERFKYVGCFADELSWQQDEADIRLRCEPEQENYFDFYGEPDSQREREAIAEQLERDGCWYVVAEYRCPTCGQWIASGSIGMIIADRPMDWRSNPYIPDLIEEALGSLAE